MIWKIESQNEVYNIRNTSHLKDNEASIILLLNQRTPKTYRKIKCECKLKLYSHILTQSL